MRSPSPETLLALYMRRCADAIQPASPAFHDGRIANDAARVIALAQADRKLGEASCNAELTSRQQKRQESLQQRAFMILTPYGLKMDNPWGLCRYASPSTTTACPRPIASSSLNHKEHDMLQIMKPDSIGECEIRNRRLGDGPLGIMLRGTLTNGKPGWKVARYDVDGGDVYWFKTRNAALEAINNWWGAPCSPQ